MNTVNTTNNRVPTGLQELYDKRTFLRKLIGGSVGALTVGLGGMQVAGTTLAQSKENSRDAQKDKTYTTRESIAIVGGLVGTGLFVTSPGILSYAILRHEDVDQEVQEAEEYLELARAEDSNHSS